MAAAFLLLCGAASLAATRKANLLLVTIDTLRRDHLGIEGGRAKTPILDGIARRGVRFESASAVAPITLPSHATIMTGLWPFHHGVRANGFYSLGGDQVTLAERLKGAGYSTAAVVSGFPLASRFGLSQGFDLYDEEFTRAQGGGSAYEAERTAGEAVDRALAVMDDLRPPWFLWLHLYDPHAEYTPPEPFRSRYREDPYDGEIAYADRELGRVVAKVEKMGLDKTLLVVTGDHGESLGEHGEKTHTIFVYQATLAVPLFFAGASVKAGGVVRTPVSTADIAPTVLDWLGVVGGEFDGESLAGLLRGKAKLPPLRPLYAESYAPRLEFGWSPLRALRRGSLKFIEAPTPELFDLETDPHELESLAPSRQKTVSEFRTLLAKIEMGAESIDRSRMEFDPESRKALESLGYVTEEAHPRKNGRLPDPKEMIALQRKMDNAIRLLSRGRAALAAKQMREVLALDPNNGFARQLLAGALVTAGDAAGAVGELQSGYGRVPRLTESALRATVGDILRRTGEFKKSERELRIAVSLDPRNIQALDLLALTELAAGKREEASKTISLALAKSPKHPRTLAVLAEIQMAEGNYAKAAANFRRALPDGGIRPRALLGLAAIHSLRHRRGKCLESLEELATTGREMTIDPEIFQQGGTLAAEMGDLELAVKLFERAAKTAPDSASILRDLGVALSRKGNHERAVEVLRKARKRAPKDAAIANALGTALARSARFGEAIEAFEAAASLDPTNEMVRENLAAARRAASKEADGR